MKAVEAVGRNRRLRLYPSAIHYWYGTCRGYSFLLYLPLIGLSRERSYYFMIVLASLVDTAEGIVDTFGIDWPMLVAQAINFDRCTNHLEVCFQKYSLDYQEREKQIADSLVNADKIKLELEETEKQQQETLPEASCR